MKNKILGIVLKTLVVITFGVLLIVNITYSKKINNNMKEDSNTINNNNNVQEDSNIIDKLVGTYEYKGSLVDEEKNSSGKDFNDEDAWKLGKMTEEKLILDKDGTATADYSNVRGSGGDAKGNWYISQDKIIIINDNCNPVIKNEKIVYPNCKKLWTYTYKVLENNIVIESNNSFLATITLNKIN